MVICLSKGRYRARLAETDADLLTAQCLRGLVFGGGQVRDEDQFDSSCDHMLVEDLSTETVVCCFRFMPLRSGREIDCSYSAQYYDLSGLKLYEGRMVEMGRFCVTPGWSDPDVLRIAWGAMTSYVDEHSIDLLFGCSSFAGTDAAEYDDTFAKLKAHHLGPERWLPHVKAPDVFEFSEALPRKPNAKKAMQRMPPLLRTYLMMGGWVSDHAVIDVRMNTLHVFTGVEIAHIPPVRKKLLRTLADGARS